MYMNDFATHLEPGFLCSFFWFFSMELTKKRTLESFFLSISDRMEADERGDVSRAKTA